MTKSEFSYAGNGALTQLIEEVRDFSDWNAVQYSVLADALADQIATRLSLGLPADDLLPAYRYASEKAASHSTLADALEQWQASPWLWHPTLADN